MISFDELHETALEKARTSGRKCIRRVVRATLLIGLLPPIHSTINAQEVSPASVATAGSQPSSLPQGSIGLMLEAASVESPGIRVAGTLQNGPADQAGVRSGDLIVAVNGNQTSRPDEFVKRITSMNPGTRIILGYIREGQPRQTTVTVSDSKKIADVVRTLADVGDADAQHSLAGLYLEGRDVPKDEAQASIWYRKSADQGNASAQFTLGWLYEVGKGVSQDSGQSALWYRKAADQGNALAQLKLGWLCQMGKGVSQDSAQAALWYRKSAEQNNPDAQALLGWLYKMGQGVPQDYSQALLWTRKSADQGNAYGQVNLAMLYWDGHGVRKDYAQAVTWFRKAADQENPDAQRTLANIYKTGVKGVSKDESQAAYWEAKAFEQFRQRAAAWRALNPKPPLPEETDRERLLAENAIQEKSFESAIEHYRQGLATFESWPQGWFNLALICGELNRFADAADGMKHYLELVPDAPDAKSAREQMIIWEHKAWH